MEEYILKPISAKQLEESLIKLKKKMDEELARKRDIAILRKSYEESFPILREQFFISMIEGRMTPRQIEVKMNQYGLSLSARHKTVYCKIELPKVANGNWRMLHLQIGESCKAFARSAQERCSA